MKKDLEKAIMITLIFLLSTAVLLMVAERNSQKESIKALKGKLTDIEQDYNNNCRLLNEYQAATDSFMVIDPWAAKKFLDLIENENE